VLSFDIGQLLVLCYGRCLGIWRTGGGGRRGGGQRRPRRALAPAGANRSATITQHITLPNLPSLMQQTSANSENKAPVLGNAIPVLGMKLKRG